MDKPTRMRLLLRRSTGMPDGSFAGWDYMSAEVVVTLRDDGIGYTSLWEVFGAERITEAPNE